ncbi:MAG: hypothetical protein M1826_007272 [Phylliscum demangeonii]|nr:MAG: hypothetical protein M1826_007272 [Phylliscum demangeonii]
MTFLHRRPVRSQPFKSSILPSEDVLEHDENSARSSPNLDEPPTRSSSIPAVSLAGAVKSAAVSFVYRGRGLEPWKNGVFSRRRSRARSSDGSNQPRRLSEDSIAQLRHPVYDEAVQRRANQRRQVLEELISSEESYIADMKILVNVYFALFASVSAIPELARASILRNLTEILALHEHLLGELHRVIPHAEYTKPSSKADRQPHQHRRSRSGSVTSTASHDKPGKNKTRPRKLLDPGPSEADCYDIAATAEPKVAKEVAHIFSGLLKRFFVYEEYGAKYEMLVQSIASTYKTIPTWQAYERGIEALANSLAAPTGDDAQVRKGLSCEDLIIKASSLHVARSPPARLTAVQPIQRVCKYPLLFAELYKATPVYDCPESHAELEKVWYRLREVTAEINQATHDPQTRDRIEKTWLLQDKILFPDQAHASQMLTLRLLGRVVLCGVLHATWQSQHGVFGDFMLCILFRSCLVLAMPMDHHCQSFSVVACVDLSSVRLERAESGRGLQCHTALFTWKIVFESDYRLFEIMLSACSGREEDAWTSALLHRSLAESHAGDDMPAKAPNLLSLLALDIKAIGLSFGQPGTLAQRISIQRASTVSAKPAATQVVIKNTHAFKDGPDSHALPSAAVNRSQSLLSTARVPVLAARRADRIRLENALAELWTRDAIPYPGMGARRGEYFIKASASSVMRKLSIASIASTFTKRSTSFAGRSSADRDRDRDRDKDRSPVAARFDPGRARRVRSGSESDETIRRPSADARRGVAMARASLPVLSARQAVPGGTTIYGSPLPRKRPPPPLEFSETMQPSLLAMDPGPPRRLTRKWSMDGIRKLFK